MKHFKVIFSLAFCLSFTISSIYAQSPKAKVLKNLDNKSAFYGQISKKIWNYAEVGYKEKQSSNLLQETLKNAGFTVESGVAEIPTAFVASFGSGSPVIGIMAEYDALPGMSQDSIPEKKSVGGVGGLPWL